MITKEELKSIFEPEQEAIQFIPKQHSDKHAAAKRYAVVEETLIDWYEQVNRTNTRELPEDLVELYNDACRVMLKIKQREEEIILGRRK